MKSKLSVIVITYNHEKYIKRCIDSIMMQKTNFQYDIILADDCSSDKTIEVVNNEYGSKVKVLSRKANVGLCKNMYDAYMSADGQYIFCCSGDDYLASDEMFQMHVNFLENNSDYFSVYNWTVFSNESSGFNKIIKTDYLEYSLLDFLQGKQVNFYVGTIRNTFKQDKPEYICKAGRNNEEIQNIYYTLAKGKKGIIPEPYYVYCYKENNGGENYNSITTNLQILKDYKMGFDIIEKADGNKHNFNIAKLRYYERYIDKILEKMGYRGVRKILGVLKLKDSYNFIRLKLLYKLKRYKMLDS